MSRLAKQKASIITELVKLASQEEYTEALSRFNQDLEKYGIIDAIRWRARDAIASSFMLAHITGYVARIAEAQTQNQLEHILLTLLHETGERAIRLHIGHTDPITSAINGVKMECYTRFYATFSRAWDHVSKINIINEGSQSDD